jgi:serine/threonine-protein kinase
MNAERLQSSFSILHFVRTHIMIGDRLGDWRIVRELGRGGMGQVYLAQEEAPGKTPGRQAAIKVLSAELALDDGFRSRFQREIEVLQTLNHPNIVRLYDSGTTNGRYFYVMEYVDGPSYEQLLVEAVRLPWREVLDLALQVSPALKHAHDRGVIHRDLKPSNLLRSAVRAADSEYGVVKLTDFGIAHVFARPHLTATGGIIGTAEYLSPEQAAGKPVTKRSDLYSLGVVLYTLLTGRNPFEGEGVVDLLHKHRFALFEQPRKLVPEIPHDLENVVCQLLEKDPERRPGDGMVLHRQLDSIRRKLERKHQSTFFGERLADTRLEKPPSIISDNPGPATLMSQLMRQELDRQNLGGPVSRFFHRPLVLVTLFVLCVGLLIWGLWPPSAASMYRHGEELMQSPNPDDWNEAWEKYFQPLQEKYPDNPYKEQIEQFRVKITEHNDEVKAQRQAKQEDGPPSEAHWFYLRGLRLRQQGDEKEAREVWRGLIASFREVPAEQPWVRLAEKELERRDQPGGDKDRRWASARAALQRARQLRQEDRQDEAKAIYQGLEQMYRNDPAAKELVDEIRREREN